MVYIFFPCAIIQKLSLPAHINVKNYGVSSKSGGMSPTKRTLHFLDSLHSVFQSMNHQQNSNNSATTANTTSQTKLKSDNDGTSPVIVVDAKTAVTTLATSSTTGITIIDNNNIMNKCSCSCSKNNNIGRHSVCSAIDCSEMQPNERKSMSNVTRILIKPDAELDGNC